MNIRDAAERDTDTLADLTGIPRDVLVNVIHDRTARLGERDGSVVGFVSFDADVETVHVTQLVGESPADCERLLEEPVRFACREGMAVELFVLETDSVLRDTISASEFTEQGPGPRFDSVRTTRYRYEP